MPGRGSRNGLGLGFRRGRGLRRHQRFGAAQGYRSESDISGNTYGNSVNPADFPRSPNNEQPVRFTRPVAVVDDKICTACGQCITACPFAAISVTDKAEIDTELCKGCGVCTRACPVGAITMKRG